MAIVTGNDPLSGAPDAGVRGRSAYGAAPSSQFSPSPAVAFPLPDPLADSGQDYMQCVVGPGPSAVLFPLQDPVAVGGGAAAHPWKVRWHEDASASGNGTGNENSGVWEVYLPYGALSIGERAYVMNDIGRGVHGGANDGDWYVIPAVQETAGKTYRVVAHGKERVKMQSGESALTRTAPFVYVCVEDADVRDPMTDSIAAKGYAGDVWSATIATISFDNDDEGNLVREIRQVLYSAVVAPAQYTGIFQPVWIFSPGEGGAAPELEALKFDERKLTVGGQFGEAPDEDMKHDGDGYIFLKIDTTGSAPELTLEFKTSDPASALGVDWVRLFHMKANRMLADHRVNLSNLTYYRGVQ